MATLNFDTPYSNALFLNSTSLSLSHHSLTHTHTCTQLHHCTDPSTRSAAPYQEPVLSTMEMEDYIKMQETTQLSGNGLARTVSTSPITPVCTAARCNSETDIMMKGPSAAMEQGHLPLSFGVLRSNHSVENIYEYVQ